MQTSRSDFAEKIGKVEKTKDELEKIKNVDGFPSDYDKNSSDLVTFQNKLL